MEKYICNRNIVIWLNSLGITSKTLKKILLNFQKPIDIWTCDSARIYKIPGIRKTTKDKIIENRVLSYLEGYFKRVEENNIEIITFLDEEYPEKLLNIPDSPCVLYYKGEELRKDLSIAVIGSRKFTDYGRWACRKITKDLVDLGVTIVSGLALGIDSIAHKTALDNNGKTIAVLGNGLDSIYPIKNINLAKDIEKSGTIVSEFPIGTPPLRYNFPMRNRIISGLVDGIIVVEAQEKSGSLITAHHALEQGKDVFSVPGNINSIFSKGTNKLIRDGAIPLLEIDDIIYEVEGLKNLKVKLEEKLDYEKFTEEEVDILRLLEKEPINADTIVYKLGLDIIKVNALLIKLEIKGVIEEGQNGRFMLI